MRAAVIIPVYNEGERVLAPIQAAQCYPEIGEVIVVNDGSLDATQEVVDSIDDITVLDHTSNQGKGEALDTGMRHALSQGYEAAVFLDGDLVGIRPDHIGQLLTPLSNGSYMAIGYLGLRKAVIKKVVLDRWGALSGQRALRTEVWGMLCDEDKHGFNIEAALNARLRKNDLHGTISRVALDGVGHVGKRVKEDSWPRGLLAYARTYSAAMMTYARVEMEAVRRNA